MKLLKRDLLYCLALVIFSVYVWLPSRFYPLFWDSTYVVMTASQIAESGFTALVSQEQGYAHPTLFPAILALLWSMFGATANIGHYLTLPFLPLLLISTYYLIKSKTNPELGFIGAAMVGFTPVVLAEYLNVYTDLPMAALVTTSLVLWNSQKYRWWVIIYAAAILTKIPAIAAMPYFLLSAWTAKNSRALTYALTAPTVVAGAWLIYHRLVSGWWLVYTQSGHSLSISRSLSAVLIGWIEIIIALFTGQGRWLPTALAVIALILLHQQARATILKIKTELVVLITGSLLFAVTGEFGYRYAIFLYPVYFTIILTTMHHLITKKPQYTKAVAIILLSILIFFTTLWRPKLEPYTRSEFNPPSDLGYIDYIQIFRWLSSYVIVNQHQNIIYYGGFPESISLLEPKMGFVTQPMPFLDCKDFTYDPSLNQVIIFHPFSPTNYTCYQLIAQNELLAFNGHEINGKWIDLYFASPSATPKQE